MTTCWLCGAPVEDPPEIIGHYRAGRCRLAHRTCMRTLGEFELDLWADTAGPVSSHEETGPAGTGRHRGAR